MKTKPITRIFSAIFSILIAHSSFAQPLNISTWNIEWLTSTPDHNIKQSQRNEQDFEKLNHYFQSLDSDVLAFQEIDSADAIQTIIGNDYTVVMSERANKDNAKHQFKDINQFTGFAIRDHVTFTNMDDLQLSGGATSKLRFASYIKVNHGQESELHILNVHLKAGCSGAYRNNRNCNTLKSQGKSLQSWIQDRERQSQSYVILGDFNHNMGYPNDWFWTQLSNNADARLITQHTKAQCKVRSRKNPTKTHQFRNLIDHIIVSNDLTTQSTEQQVFESNDVLDYQLSDHCPVSTQINK